MEVLIKVKVNTIEESKMIIKELMEESLGYTMPCNLNIEIEINY